MEIITIDNIPILAYNTWRGVDAPFQLWPDAGGARIPEAKGFWDRGSGRARNSSAHLPLGQAEHASGSRYISQYNELLSFSPVLHSNYFVFRNAFWHHERQRVWHICGICNVLGC
jgi:hypothetical protein